MTYFNSNQAYPLGIDLSVYNLGADRQRYPDFDLIAAHIPRVEFVALRAGQSYGYRDPAFRTYLQAAQRADLCILPYHVVYPGVAALRQMDAFLDILDGADLDSLRLVLDLELDHDQSRAVITNTTLCCLELLKQETGRYPLIYSRALWVDAHLEVNDLPELDWWLAQYRYRQEYPAYTPEYPCPPMLPRGVRTWRIHQTAERAPAIGGVGRYMDTDRWNGSNESLLAYFGKLKPKPVLICPLDGRPCSGSPKLPKGNAADKQQSEIALANGQPAEQTEIKENGDESQN